MTRLLLNVARTAVLFSFALSASAYAEDINSTLYLETKNPLKLYKGGVLSNGDRALIPQVEVPAESIVAIAVKNASLALTASKDSPERVNFPFVNSSQDTVTQRNNAGWMCGLRIVDVTTEELREDEMIEGNDFCLSMKDIKNVTAMGSNGELALASFQRFENKDDISMLNALSDEIQTLERIQRENPTLVPIRNSAPAIISPIKNCGKGCLVASSEYGMRFHPVYKKKKLHKGIDLKASTGTKVVSVFKGKVLANRTETNRKTKKITGYGHYVIVVHPEAKMETLYAHLSAFKKKAGDAVNQGTEIGLSGSSGVGTGPHLHFETHPEVKGKYQLANPRNYIGSMLAKLASLLKDFMFFA